MIQKSYGQIFLKYLVSLPTYSEKGYTLPTLANDLVFIGRKAGLTEKKNLTVATIYNWIRGSKIPFWAQVASFELATRHGWRIIDKTDLNDAVQIVLKRDKATDEKRITSALTERGLIIPQPLVNDFALLLENIGQSTWH
uniref:Uncharacterized protein n=1 Tax=Vibrio sp. FF_291 TaxID=1652832 RepID=A0A0H3ZUU3_9VIBR|nr:hypothetical protein [Vibrio sp. FF_291]